MNRPIPPIANTACWLDKSRQCVKIGIIGIYCILYFYYFQAFISYFSFIIIDCTLYSYSIFHAYLINIMFCLTDAPIERSKGIYLVAIMIISYVSIMFNYVLSYYPDLIVHLLYLSSGRVPSQHCK